MKIIVDADSLIYASACVNDDLDSAFTYFVDKLNSILDVLSNDIGEGEVVICNGSRNCFRNDINDKYKANRTQDKPEILNELHELIKKRYNSYWGDGVETDDIVATLWKVQTELNGLDSCVIVSSDKDYKQLPCWIFDSYYKRLSLSKVDDFESELNFFTQMIVGDSADNINYCKGYGLAYTKKIFKNVCSSFGLLRKTYYLYKSIYGDKARDKFDECYSLLRLKTNAYEYIRKGQETPNTSVN